MGNYLLTIWFVGLFGLSAAFAGPYDVLEELKNDEEVATLKPMEMGRGYVLLRELPAKISFPNSATTYTGFLFVVVDPDFHDYKVIFKYRDPSNKIMRRQIAKNAARALNQTMKQYVGASMLTFTAYARPLPEDDEGDEFYRQRNGIVDPFPSEETLAATLDMLEIHFTWCRAGSGIGTAEMASAEDWGWTGLRGLFHIVGKNRAETNYTDKLIWSSFNRAVPIKSTKEKNRKICLSSILYGVADFLYDLPY